MINSNIDPNILKFTKKELMRQQNHIELIASENYVSPAILKLAGTVLTNKYSEGYPRKRYYGGCEFIDKIEQLAIDKAKTLFKADHVNVQPHSGSQANAAAYLALLNPGDCVLAMSLDSGGHLTHGFNLNFSGKIYNFIKYNVNSKTEILDYDEIEKIALAKKPKLIVAGASAYSRTIDFKRFREIANKVNAYLMVDMAHIAGLVATNLHPSPVPYADVITSTTHKTLRGPRGGLILCKAKIAKKIDSAVFPGTQGGPLEHIIAAKAQCFIEASKPEFTSYQKRVIENCKIMVDEFKKADFRIVSERSDNHLLVIDVKSSLKMTGKEAEKILEKTFIVCNKNMIPFDSESAFKTSGIRLGSAAMTTRGFTKSEFLHLSQIIISVLKDHSKANILKNRHLVSKLVNKFKIYKKVKY